MVVSTQFGALLKEFEKYFHCPLTPDANDSCMINLGGLSLQIELDRYHFLLAGCRLGRVLMGRYRDNLIRAALKSNESTSLSTGIIGFSQKSSQLILFIKLDPGQLTLHQITSILPPFLEKARVWTQAIANGEIPENKEHSSPKPSGLFGLIS